MATRAAGTGRAIPAPILVLAAGIAALLAVGPAVVAQGPSPSPAGPVDGPIATPSAPSPGPSRATRGEASDETLEIVIETDRTQVPAGEPIAIGATLRFLPDQAKTVSGSGGGLVSFGIEQLDGPRDMGPAQDASCAPYPFSPGEVRSIAFEKSGGFSQEDPLAAFWSAWFADPELWLPAGTYRISAHVDYLDGPSCPLPSRHLEASVIVEVTPSQAASTVTCIDPGTFGRAFRRRAIDCEDAVLAAILVLRPEDRDFTEALFTFNRPCGGGGSCGASVEPDRAFVVFSYPAEPRLVVRVDRDRGGDLRAGTPEPLPG